MSAVCNWWWSMCTYHCVSQHVFSLPCKSLTWTEPDSYAAQKQFKSNTTTLWHYITQVKFLQELLLVSTVAAIHTSCHGCHVTGVHLSSYSCSIQMTSWHKLKSYVPIEVITFHFVCFHQRRNNVCEIHLATFFLNWIHNMIWFNLSEAEHAYEELRGTDEAMATASQPE